MIIIPSRVSRRSRHHGRIRNHPTSTMPPAALATSTTRRTTSFVPEMGSGPGGVRVKSFERIHRPHPARTTVTQTAPMSPQRTTCGDLVEGAGPLIVGAGCSFCVGLFGIAAVLAMVPRSCGAIGSKGELEWFGPTSADQAACGSGREEILLLPEP